MAVLLGLAPTKVSAQTQEQLKQVEAALPPLARVTPAAPRKLLVFTGCKGYRHEAIEIGTKTLEMMGAATGAFTTVASDDIAMFEPANLQQFDAVCFNNSTGDLFLPGNLADLTQEQQQAAREYDALLKESLLDFVRGGKGVIGIHAATDAWYGWAEYGERMGGYFWGHPWNEDVAVKVDDPLNALSAAFDVPTFTIADEIYQFKEPYSRESLRVLLSLDVTKTNMDKGDAIHRTDNDFAVAWIRSYGEGRVFYCSLGHRPEVFMNPMILQFYLDGIQFAMGDLDADTTPSAALSADYRARDNAARRDLELNAALKAVVRLEYGDGVEATSRVEQAARDAHGDAQATARLAARLSEMLAREDATPAGKRFLAEQLSLCGTGTDIAPLVQLLDDPALADLGRFGLERIPGKTVDAALVAALADGTSLQQIGIANTLGRRGSKASVRALAALMNSTESSDVAYAAAAALGKIGGRKAVAALRGTDYVNNLEFADAQIVAARELLKAGKKRAAARAFKYVLDNSHVDGARWAAFVGVMTARGVRAVPDIIAALEGDDAVLQSAANHCVREVGDSKATRAFASRLPRLAPATQALVIAALSDRGDTVACPAVLDMLDSPDAGVRLAAVRALAEIGDDSAVLPLAHAAATAGPEESDEARKSLTLLGGSQIDETITSLIPVVDVAEQVELIRSTAPRFAESTVPVLLEAAGSQDENVRAEAFKSLGVLAGPQDLPNLIALLDSVDGAKARKEAERAVALVARKVVPEDAQADMLLAHLVSLDPADTETRISLLKVLGQVSGPKALEAVRAGTHDAAESVREAAARVLMDWSDSEPVEDLLVLAETGDTETLRILALRAALHMLSNDSVIVGQPTFVAKRSTTELLNLYKQAMDLATRPEEKKLILAGLATVRSDAAADYVRRFVNDPALRAEAKQALAKLEAHTRQAYSSHNPGVAQNVLDDDPNTLWDTRAAQVPDMWIMVDLGQVRPVHEVMIQSPASRLNDFAREYAIYLSSDLKNWGEPVATGSGVATIDVTFKPRKARFVAIEQLGEARGWWWSIDEISVK